MYIYIYMLADLIGVFPSRLKSIPWCRFLDEIGPWIVLISFHFPRNIFQFYICNNSNRFGKYPTIDISIHTVDGRNPAAGKKPFKFMGETSNLNCLVQDFFHQQYHKSNFSIIATYRTMNISRHIIWTWTMKIRMHLWSCCTCQPSNRTRWICQHPRHPLRIKPRNGEPTKMERPEPWLFAVFFGGIILPIYTRFIIAALIFGDPCQSARI